jgi:hypothetical protein
MNIQQKVLLFGSNSIHGGKPNIELATVYQLVNPTFHEVGFVVFDVVSA